MADTYTSLLRFLMQEDLSNTNKWGGVFNAAVSDLVEEALAGKATIDVTFNDVTLTPKNGQPDNARPMFLEITGNPGAVRTITVPNSTKFYVIVNKTTPAQSIKMKSSASSAITITASQSPTIVFVDSTNSTIHTLGRSDAVANASAWTEIDLYEEGVAGVVVTAEYTKQGNMVTLYIPAFTHTFSGLIMAFRVGGPSGVLPSEIAYTASIEANWPTWVHDSGNGLIPAYMRLSNVSNRIQWTDADPTTNLFTNGGTRRIFYDQTYTYTVKS